MHGFPRCTSPIANLKRVWIGTFHGVSDAQLQKYLDGFVYRYNRCFWQYASQKNPAHFSG